MCHFISVTLPVDADLDVLASIATSYRRALTPSCNSSIAARLPSSRGIYLTTTTHCDCGTVLGSANRDRSSVAPADVEKQLAAFRRRGWSATKITRWQEQQSQITSRSSRIRHDHLQQQTAEAEQWLQFIRAILASGTTDSLGLILHWYGGALESERIELSDQIRVRSSDLDTDFLLQMREDVLYEFHV